MKNHIATVLAIYEGIFLDATARWSKSTDRRMDKDLSYLRMAAEQRGLSFFTLTLPEYGKAIDLALHNRSFLQRVPQGIPVDKGGPVLFRTFLKKVFDDSWTLRSDADTEAVFFLRQLCYCFKKYRLKCSPLTVERTLDEFYQTEEHLPAPHPETFWDETPRWADRWGHPLWGPFTVDREATIPGIIADRSYLVSDRTWDTLRLLARRVVSSMGTPSWWDLEPKHGPGVVSEASEIVSKYDFRYWPSKLDSVFPYDWFGSGRLDLDYVPDNREPPSRLIAVPKTQKGPRLICAEPAAHQYMQQSIWRWLRDAVKRTVLGRSITFESQEASRERALLASIDGQDATFDLKEASDRLSCRLVEYIFQGSELLNGLHACRTRLLAQTISENHPKVIAMKKFAPMGSAVTFPIQSIVFTILTVWALRLAEGREDDWNDWESDFDRVTVFGDDIIAPNSASETIISVLTECGLKVNTAKSFVSPRGDANTPEMGYFRESCGMDAFKGVDVTPAYILETYDGSPASMASVVETSNNLFLRGLWNAALATERVIPEKELKLLPVVARDAGILGLISHCGMDPLRVKWRWNPDLHRYEFRHLSVTSKVTKVRGTGFSSLAQYFIERPSPDLPWESGQVRSVSLRKRVTWSQPKG